MTKIIGATKPDGTWAFTKRNARPFTALGKKDSVSAAMYGSAAFLMWLPSGAWRSRLAPGGCGGIQRVVGGRLDYEEPTNGVDEP